MLRVFVYGSLKPGEKYFDRYCAPYLVEMQEAIVYGTLYDLPVGYPAILPGRDPVRGYLFTFEDPEALTLLDELEEYQPDRPVEQNEYQRREIETFDLHQQPLGRAWIYEMTQEQVEALGGVILPEGNWSRSAIEKDDS
ncbi:gamma-glutamylcyclotransferase family protein [Leptolyngbya ohadii]|uniref:gamma-glutamylcyclotransferase family protein n=1 Tax=Leptolyngbya ohadii TaxID=1962290 RepID=UPI000B5A2281|nr:gamma-glutamylcyclotransferase [Leptolyngbya ohadii]